MRSLARFLRGDGRRRTPHGPSGSPQNVVSTQERVSGTIVIVSSARNYVVLHRQVSKASNHDFDDVRITVHAGESPGVSLGMESAKHLSI